VRIRKYRSLTQEKSLPRQLKLQPKKEAKHTMPQKLKEHHTKAFAEHHEHAAKHHRKAVIATSVCDHRLGYQHARRTDTVAAAQFLHHVLGNNFQ
jgi:hypothetical protein